MTQITIDIPDESDVAWIIELLERLRFEYKISNDKILDSTKFQR